MFDFSLKKLDALKKARSGKAKLFALAGAGLFFAISGQNVSAASTDTVIASEGSNVVSTATNSAVIGGSDGTIKSGASQSAIIGGTKDTLDSDTKTSVIAGGTDSIIKGSSSNAFIGERRKTPAFRRGDISRARRLCASNGGGLFSDLHILSKSLL